MLCWLLSFILIISQSKGKGQRPWLISQVLHILKILVAHGLTIAALEAQTFTKCFFYIFKFLPIFRIVSLGWTTASKLPQSQDLYQTFCHQIGIALQKSWHAAATCEYVRFSTYCKTLKKKLDQLMWKNEYHCNFYLHLFKVEHGSYFKRLQEHLGLLDASFIGYVTPTASMRCSIPKLF